MYMLPEWLCYFLCRCYRAWFTCPIGTRMHKYTSTTKVDIAWGAETDYDIKEASLNDTVDAIKHPKHIAILFRLNVCSVTLKGQGDTLMQTSSSLSANNFPLSTSIFIFREFHKHEFHFASQNIYAFNLWWLVTINASKSWNQSFLLGNMMDSCLITFVHLVQNVPISSPYCSRSCKEMPLHWIY